MTTGKNIALTTWTFVDIVMSLLLICCLGWSQLFFHQSNRQIWPWSTEWSKTKANRVFPREHTGHCKHPLPITKEKTLTWTLPGGQYWNQIDYILCSQRWRSSISSVQFSHSVMSDSLQPHESQHTRPPCPSPTPRVHSDSLSLSEVESNSTSVKLTDSIESVMPSSHLILCHSLLLLPPISPNIRVFSKESVLPMRWPKYWSFSFSITPSHEHPGLISFRMDWLDLLAVQGTLKSLLQHHSSKASILQRSAFFASK